ncbi:MAG: pitrilysin family protein [Pseudomonadota bacterium]|nr:pitrilysin family protein [Pseudomonadota bacterium]
MFPLFPMSRLAQLALASVAVGLLACGPKVPVAPPPVAAPVAAPVDLLGPRPAVGAEVPFALPTPETTRLSNGAGVWVIPAPTLPLVTVSLSVPGGSSVDAPGKEGTAAMGDRLLTQGAGKRDARAFAAAVEELGAQLDVDTGRAASTITMSFTKDKMGPALDLLADMVLRPRLTAVDFAREKGILASDLRMEQDEPVAVAAKQAWVQWFGPAHPYSRSPGGTVKGMDAVSWKDAKGYHKLAWNAAGAKFTVAGAVTKDELVAALEPRFGAPWKAGKAAVATLPPVPVHESAPIVLVDKPGSSQTMFYLVFDGPAFGDPSLAPVKSGTVVLGGTFTSRLNALLREKRGYTYGVRAGVQALPGAGVRTITTRIRTDATAPAMTDLMGELTAIRAGVTPEEVTKARAAYRQDLVEAMESRAGMAGTFAPYHSAGLDAGTLAVELGAMQAVTPDQVKAAMSAYDPTKAVIVLVGDKAVIQEPLAKAGFDKIVVVEPL